MIQAQVADRRWIRGPTGGLCAALLVLATGFTLAPAARAQDTLSVPALEALPGTIRAVPVSVRDISGTTLDEGDGENLEVQGFSFRLFFSPAAAVTSVGFVQKGVTAGKTPIFPVITPGADNIFVILSFDAETDPLAYTLNAPPPGNVVGELRFTISPAATLGSTITLTLDSSGNAALVNDAATLSETVANGQLALANGWIFLDGDIHADGFESGNTCGWSSSAPAPVCP